MSFNVQNCFTFDYKSVLIDEIALNGLEGISIDFLWKRVGKRLSCVLTQKIKRKFWNFITSLKCISFYNLNTPILKLEIIDRFTIVNEDTGQLKEPAEPLDGPYEYCPIQDEYGSCSSYKTRVLIPHEFISLKTYDEIVELYGDTLVLVASVEERWKALAPHLPLSILPYLTPTHYCILELVGRGRENGQMTVGNTNLNKILKDAKLLFYNRNHLQKLDLIKIQCITQIIGERGMKSLILRLKRFHQPFIRTQPKVGRIHDIAEYLLKQPNYTEKNEMIIRKGLMTPHQSKRLQKTVNVFKFVDSNEKRHKFISLVSQSDESSQSEDESQGPPLKCKYNIGIGLLRQAYERFIEAGLKGLTQIEISQLLGIEFYTSRTICRIFKMRGIVREFLEDKGRQRTARYIAVAATNEIDRKFAAEKKKLMDNLKKNRKRGNEDDASEVPAKKIKEGPSETKNEKSDEFDDRIIEIKVLDGFQDKDKESLIDNKKRPTLRQLRFATGIIKVVKDNGYITGYQTLSTMVSAETGESPMDTKSLKHVLQKLITDGQLKIFKFKVTCRGIDKYSLYICPSYIQKTDTVIKTYYNELCRKAQQNSKNPLSKKCRNVTRPLTQFTYPRYLKIQKLHEHIMKLVYFNEVKTKFAPGFTSLQSIVPDMTVEFALGNISFVNEAQNVVHLKICDDVLEVKLKDAPDNVRSSILNSRSLRNSLRTSLKILASMGLIQLVKDPFSCVIDRDIDLNFVFYVNQKAKLLDTSGVWPRQNTKSAVLEKSYHFKTFDDVIKYWDDVQTIGLSTTVSGVKRDKYKLFNPVRNENEVVLHDDGSRYGDGLGPCGFDASLYIDMVRLWRTYSSRYLKPQIVRVIKSKVKHKRGRRKYGPRKETKEGKKRRKKKSKPKSEALVTKEIARRKPRGLKSDQPLKWTKLDDQVISMLNIAITIMGPVPGAIKLRNCVAKNLLVLTGPGKQAFLCHRRAMYLETNPEIAHEKLCILNELRRRPALIQKYEGVLKMLRMKHYSNLPKFIKEAKIPILEVLWIINQVAKTKPYIQKMPCVSANLEEFKKNYTITSPSLQKLMSQYKTLDSEPELTVLKEGIVMAVMLSLHGEFSCDLANKVYSIFQVHPENDLRRAIEDLRKCGAIAAREKVLNNILLKVHLNDIIQSSYKISHAYRKKWNNRLHSKLDESVASLLDTVLPQDGLKGSSAINCVLFEMQTCDLLEVTSVTVPVIVGSSGSLIQEEKMNIIDMESKLKLKSGLAGWRNLSNYKTFSELYKDIDYHTTCSKLNGINVVLFDDKEPNIEDKQDDVVKYLITKGKNGCTFKELKEHTMLDSVALHKKLETLEAKECIMRMGYFDNRVVLKEFSKPWLFQIDQNKCIIPAPWFDLEGKLRKDVFLIWTSAVMNKIFESPGASIEYMSNYFEYITVRSVQDICIFLMKCGCIELKCLYKIEADLFSDDDAEPELSDYNEYESPSNIVAFPVKNSLTKFSFIKHRILNGS